MDRINRAFQLSPLTLDKFEKVVQKCYDLLWEGGKRDPLSAFNIFNVIILLKLFDESESATEIEYQFQTSDSESSRKLKLKIDHLYQKMQTENPILFAKPFEVPKDLLKLIIKTLQIYSFSTTDLDIKGQAFEIFFQKFFRGEAGQYFTPRNIVKFMVGVLNPSKNDLILDPACGSGGFLTYSLFHMNKTQFKSDPQEITAYIKKHLFGIEINDNAARTAFMNLSLYGKDHNNILCTNALQPYSRFSLSKIIEAEKFSLIMTNPPFGSLIHDPSLLEQYTLTKGKNAQKTEILFLERCLDLLKVKG